MSLAPAPDRRQQPRIAGMVVTQPADLDADQPIIHIPDLVSTVPPQAGNVWFVGPEPTDDLDADQPDWWPVTGLQIAAFWALFAIVVVITVSACVLVAGHAWGLSNGDIVGALLAWGGA